jgi:hypothetical protein
VARVWMKVLVLIGCVGEKFVTLNDKMASLYWL